jgi:Subtilase family
MSFGSFSARVRDHPRVAEIGGLNPLVLAVNKQLLVCTNPTHPADDAAPSVKKYLDSRKIHHYTITTLMTGLWPSQSGEDVEILHVEPKGSDIFELVADLRGGTGPPLVRADPGKVSPNHVLIPANEDHSCPYGPPGNGLRGTLLEVDPVRRVVIIDSGYQWSDDWGENPLRDVTSSPADYVSDPQGVRRILGKLGLGPPTGWWPSLPDVMDHAGKKQLDALAGHANFIAGIIRQRTSHAAIEVLNHNGGFQYGGDDLPTELSVVRSLCKCRALNADVINLGFAFAAFDDTLSCAWEIAFHEIAGSANGHDPVVVAPTGNQHSRKPRYPAALRDDRNQKYLNVVGVGSTKGADDDRMPADLHGPFSNFGSWVTCSADGANVDSTFLSIPEPILREDGDEDPVDFSSGWARWNGTSFATPKVAAEIVNAIVDQGLEPVKAWEWLRDTQNIGRDVDLGHTFDF